MSRWLGAWEPVVRHVLTLPAHKEIAYTKTSLPRPLDGGFRLSTGLPKFQLFDYRLALPDGRGIHIREYAEAYTIHWDRKDPKVDLIGHLIEDSPKAFVALAAIGGIAAAVWASRKGLPITAY